jgi:ppGpp synthetase/RelA/SpoT-type nucleotidyltranferase
MMALARRTLEQRYDAEHLRFERAQVNLMGVIHSVLEDLAPTRGIRSVPLVEGSIKDFPSFWEKAQRLEHEGRVRSPADCFQEIHDIARARIICKTVADADRIRRLMSDQDEVLFTSKEEQIHAPAPGIDSTGYRAIHMDLEIDVPVNGKPVATPCELQVMTALQYAWGLYTHKDFYKGEGVPPLVGELMRELSDLLNVADRVASHLIREVESKAA